MKKYFIILLVISMICIIASFFLFRFAPIEGKTDITSQVLNERESKYGEEIDDAEGYELLINLTGALASDAAGTLTKVIILIIPAFLLFLVGICQIISGLVQIGKDKKWKNTTSKVFISISLVFLVMICIFLLKYLITGVAGGKMHIFIAFLFNIICLVMHIITLIKANKIKTEQQVEPISTAKV